MPQSRVIDHRPGCTRPRRIRASAEMVVTVVVVAGRGPRSARAGRGEEDARDHAWRCRDRGHRLGDGGRGGIVVVVGVVVGVVVVAVAMSVGDLPGRCAHVGAYAWAVSAVDTAVREAARVGAAEAVRVPESGTNRCAAVWRKGSRPGSRRELGLESGSVLAEEAVPWEWKGAVVAVQETHLEGTSARECSLE